MAVPLLRRLFRHGGLFINILFIKEESCNRIFAGILTLNRAYLTTYNDGNTSELFAFMRNGFLMFYYMP